MMNMCSMEMGFEIMMNDQRGFQFLSIEADLARI